MARNLFGRKNGDLPTKHIVVPVKGDEIDEEAMRIAYTYAQAKMDRGRNVAVDVVYVVEVPHALPLDAQLDNQVDTGERALDYAEKVAAEIGLKVETSLLQARSAGAAIVDMATEIDAELIVMATGYQKKLGELDLGHTIPYVLKNARCRVWICRARMPDTRGTGS